MADVTLRVLLLGGTAEARRIAGALAADARVHVVSSLAGRVSEPALPAGEVRVGGFGGADGLAAWLQEHRIGAVVDATHPFAARITASAVAACAGSGVPLLVLRRPGWEPTAGDDWRTVPTLDAAAALLPGLGRRVFLTTGRHGVAPFAAVDAWFLVRSIEPPEPPVPPRWHLLLDRGPFTLPGELALLRDHRIDVVVTKDSGGAMTAAKLHAARVLHLPVIVVGRPSEPAVTSVGTVEAALRWVARRAAPD